ncbi:MAG: endolytic transglycosylase MltG [Gordonibacter sp.]|uniref:endolytic transglycosylase MltG n=1 Tax=Gordonibacter sp. TaxID=1968902 RepID=UPI002FCA9CD9
MPPRKQFTYSQRPNHAARSAHARGEREFRTYDTSYIRPKQSKGPIIFAIVLALVVVGGLVWGATALFGGLMGGSSAELLASGEKASLTVAEGSGAQAIGKQLQEARLVPSATDFTKRVSELGADAKLKSGAYLFVGGTSVDDLIAQIIAGPVSAGGLTVPEGVTLAKTAELVAQATNGKVTAEAFTAAASDASVYAAEFPFLASAGTNSLEGFLFPKTYSVGDGTTAESLVKTMLAQFQKEIATLSWSYPESQGLSTYDAVKLASIVERESSGDEPVRAKVAAVFYNRLATQGEPSNGFLQSDATTAYEVGHDPSAEEVHAQTPYSTYANPGLPPTPICSPGLDCLQAVCAPDQEALGKYFFFFFDKDANYFFSETYEQHQKTFS